MSHVYTVLQDGWEVLIERGHVTVQHLLERQEQNGGRKLRLTLDPAARCGPPQVSPSLLTSISPPPPPFPPSLPRAQTS